MDAQGRTFIGHKRSIPPRCDRCPAAAAVFASWWHASLNQYLCNTHSDEVALGASEAVQ